MGCYINTPSPLGKAQWLIDNHGAELMELPEYSDSPWVTVCVVSNGPFEAAGVLYDSAEFARASNGTRTRPTTWLRITRKKAFELCPDVASKMND